MFSPSFRKDLYTSGCAKYNNLFSVQQLTKIRILLGKFYFFCFLFSLSLLKYLLGKWCDAHQNSLSLFLIDSQNTFSDPLPQLFLA